ncbi:DUF6452 family protein [Aquimarina sp. RZ0]|uniref:DUF6452 family protein n=1 Tax=Aquimarina sp. RZ0 TaxID=2607730 RepID=UPI0011F27DF9|nr:DUF6452 family protein [Aquimarina sp. RZ0]KAA1246973.1 hypothetical protein F0000_05810 [Aquimarina sp. RZ0]
MRLFKTIILIICSITVIHFSISCERDDICAENAATTPFLIIKFIDDVTATDTKRPNELQIGAEGSDTVINFETNLDSIMIPLKTDASLTNFRFTIDSDTTDDATIPNVDMLSFQYSPQEEYVSSACGFRVIYNGLTNSLTPEEGGENWIKRISILEQNIINETNAHVLIFH